MNRIFEPIIEKAAALFNVDVEFIKKSRDTEARRIRNSIAYYLMYIKKFTNQKETARIFGITDMGLASSLKKFSVEQGTYDSVILGLITELLNEYFKGLQ